jgi:hypothetical protein
MVELRKRKKEIRGYGGNHDKTLGHYRISCASQLTIPDPAGTTPDPDVKNTDARSSIPSQASHTPNRLYTLGSSMLFASLSSFSLSHPELYHHSRTQF